MRTRSAGSSQFNSAGTDEAKVGRAGVAATAALAANKNVSRRLKIGNLVMAHSPINEAEA